MSNERLVRYVTQQLRKRFLGASVTASYDGDAETWTARVGDVVYTMPVGSDDDEFSFYPVGVRERIQAVAKNQRLSGAARHRERDRLRQERVAFDLLEPLPDFCHDCGRDYDAMTAAERSRHVCEGEAIVLTCSGRANAPCPHPETDDWLSSDAAVYCDACVERFHEDSCKGHPCTASTRAERLAHWLLSRWGADEDEVEVCVAARRALAYGRMMVLDTDDELIERLTGLSDVGVGVVDPLFLSGEGRDRLIATIDSICEEASA